MNREIVTKVYNSPKIVFDPQGICPPGGFPVKIIRMDLRHQNKEPQDLGQEIPEPEVKI